ncbi:MAG TPA: hypothetical protein VGC99_20330 [Candidatus Tectomicrobia bacterium]
MASKSSCILLVQNQSFRAQFCRQDNGRSCPIVQQRRLQTLIAALHCSYPQLLPGWLRSMSTEAIQKESEELKWALHRT